MVLALPRATARPTCSSTKALKLGVTVLDLALLHLREKVAHLDIFFPFRRKRLVALPAERDPAPRSHPRTSCTPSPTVPPTAGTRGRRGHPPPPRLRAWRRWRRCRCGPA